MLINAGAKEIEFTLPLAPGGAWELQLDSAQPELPRPGAGVTMPSCTVPARALLILSSAPVSS